MCGNILYVMTLEVALEQQGQEKKERKTQQREDTGREEQIWMCVGYDYVIRIITLWGLRKAQRGRICKTISLIRNSLKKKL